MRNAATQDSGVITAIGEYSLRWMWEEQVQAAPDVAALVATYSSLLYRIAYSVLRNSAEAEDVVQDTFVRVLERPARLAEVRELRPWLVRIAWNLSLDRRRRIRPDQMDDLFAAKLTADQMPADLALAEAQRMANVLREMDLLPSREREVLLLSALEELSTAEIGAILGRSESTIRSLIFRARTRLRERLRQGDPA